MTPLEALVHDHRWEDNIVQTQRYKKRMSDRPNPIHHEILQAQGCKLGSGDGQHAGTFIKSERISS